MATKYPGLSLASTVEGMEKLFGEIQRSEVDGITAAKALGYAGDNGAARTKLAALNAYGLINRTRSQVSISELGISIAHPLGDSRKKGLRDAALKPPLFQSIYKDNGQLSEKVLASTLVHQGFDPVDAEFAARIYKDNIKFAELDSAAQSPQQRPSESPVVAAQNQAPTSESSAGKRNANPVSSANVLANYTIPLGANEAQLTFTGKTLEPADFDALIEYVELFKKQFQRASAVDASKAKDIIEAIVKDAPPTS